MYALAQSTAVPAAAEARVCRAIVDLSPAVDQVFLTEPTEISSQSLKDRDLYETIVRGSARVDIDNNGAPDFVVELLFASGAGRGCDFNYFGLADPQGTGLSLAAEHLQVLKLQGLEESGFQQKYCGSVENRLITFEGKTYYESNFQNNPARPRTVAILEAGSVHTVCDFGRPADTSGR